MSGAPVVLPLKVSSLKIRELPLVCRRQAWVLRQEWVIHAVVKMRYVLWGEYTTLKISDSRARFFPGFILWAFPLLGWGPGGGFFWGGHPALCGTRSCLELPLLPGVGGEGREGPGCR